MAAALVADRLVDAQMAAQPFLILALIHPTLQLVAVVTAVILSVTNKFVVNTNIVVTPVLVIAALALGLRCINVMQYRVAHGSVFILTIWAIPSSITEPHKRNTADPARTSHEVLRTNLVFTQFGLIAVVLTIIVTIAKEVVKDAAVVCTLELVFLADVVTNLVVLVRAFFRITTATVIVAVTHPALRNALALRALEVGVLATGPSLALRLLLIAPVLTVRRAVTAPVLADTAPLVLTLEGQGPTGV